RCHTDRAARRVPARPPRRPGRHLARAIQARAALKGGATTARRQTRGGRLARLRRACPEEAVAAPPSFSIPNRSGTIDQMLCTERICPHVIAATDDPLAPPLGDFTATSRLITISGLAIGLGIISAYVALALLELIGLFTNLFFFQRVSTAMVSP